MLIIKNIAITAEILKAISEIDEFKGKWRATQDLAPDRLKTLKRIATIESIGSSTRIEGAKLSFYIGLHPFMSLESQAIK